MQYRLTRKNTKYVLVALALIFHSVGLIGIGVLGSDDIRLMTPYHLSLMFLLLLISYADQWREFAKWAVPTFIVGYAVEWIGVHTGLLFGTYEYTSLLGMQVDDVPLIIGCNWVVVLTGAISLAYKVTQKRVFLCLLAATIATAYDWVLEPMAIKLEYWTWADNIIPALNYICWWLVSFLLTLLWSFFKVVPNKFGLILFIVQLVFFILLRWML